jgi:hypothetical protein
MADVARGWNWGSQGQAFTMRALWRLATWGIAAAASLLVAVLAAYSENGSQRLTGVPARPDPAELARKLDVETHRLASQVHTLTADRDRLAARVASLEHNLDDVTGSIKRQAALAKPPPAAAPVALAPAAEAAPAAPAPPKPAAVQSAPQAEPKVGASEPPPPVVAAHDSDADADKTEFGADIGGATSFEGARALWTSTRKAHAALFEGLEPVLKVRENSKKKAIELRLIAGPLATEEAAGRLCAALVDAKRHCRPVAFEGQRLSQAEKPPQRKHAPAHRAAPTSRSVWPFR